MLFPYAKELIKKKIHEFEELYHYYNVEKGWPGRAANVLKKINELKKLLNEKSV